MDNLVMASTAADAAAAVAIEQHHAQLAGSLALQVEGLVAAAAGRNDDAAERSRTKLVDWCERELVPHALAEERAMYPAAQAAVEGRLLVDGMLGEHVALTGLVSELSAVTDPVRAAAVARALQTLFESHLAKENELIVPLLAAATDVTLASILEGMHEVLGGEPEEETGHEHGAATAGCGGHACSCGETDGPGFPELDARAVPHAIRHATIFGALDAVTAGGGLVLVAPHDPLPLLAQVEQRAPGTFEVEYLERGPDAWRLAFIRTA